MNGYQTYPAYTDVTITNDLTAGNITLNKLGTSVSGIVNGVWNGIYSLNGNIVIPTGDSLIVQAGSQIRIPGPYHIYVYGTLKVNGTVGDSVLITSLPSNQVYAPGQWQGIIFFSQASAYSYINYAIIQYADTGITWNNCQSSLTNSRISYCSNWGLYMNGGSANVTLQNVNVGYNGNGIYDYYGTIAFTGIICHNNSSYGAEFYTGYGTVKNSYFNSNGSHGIYCVNWGGPTFDSIQANGNYGSGAYNEYTNPSYINSRFAGNHSFGLSFNNDNYSWITVTITNCIAESNWNDGFRFGHYLSPATYMTNCISRFNLNRGVSMSNYCELNLINNVITNNSASGIYIADQDWNYPIIQRNIISYNGSHGIYKNNNGHPTIQFNTIYGNSGDGIQMNYNSDVPNDISDNIIVNNNGYGVNANESIQIFQYNDVYSNASGQLNNLSNFLTSTWSFNITNANGTPADIFLNISANPQFNLSTASDFSLKGTSACINAGNPAIKDSDGTVADIGAIYHNSGNPSTLQSTGFGNHFVSLVWNKVTLDSLQSYKVYYKLSGASSYTLFQSTTNTVINVTGLTNDSNYMFAVTGKYPKYESIYSPIVTQKPGSPHVLFNPLAINVTITTDTLKKTVKIKNTGTSDLSINFPYGMSNGYMHLNGSNSGIQTNYASQLEGMSSLTLEAWVRRTGNGYAEIVSNYYTEYALYIDGNNYFGMYKGYNAAGTRLYQGWTSTYQLPLNQWHHLAITWAGNTLTFYADGNIVSVFNNAVSQTIPAWGYGLSIGYRISDNCCYFPGDIQEVRVWNILRSQTTLKQWMNTQLKGTEAGLAGYWPLHADILDHSTYALSTWAPWSNAPIKSAEGAGYQLIPMTLSTQNLLVPPGVTDSVIFAFPNTGQTGTYVYKLVANSNIIDSSNFNYNLSLTYGTAVPSTPVHFVPVASTGLPYQIVVTDAQIDSVEIHVGDEVGVYDGALCVGAAIYTGTYNLVITAWQETSPGNGFVPGHTMSFIVYSNAAALQATIVSLNYSVGNGTFGYGTFSSLSIMSTIYQIQTVPIPANQFNLISFNLLPRYPSAATIFGNVNNLQIAYNDNGAAFIPQYDINSIGQVDFRKAFYVYTTKTDTIPCTGTAVNPMDWSIQLLPDKWNYVSFLGLTPLAITSAFTANIIDTIDIVQTSAGKIYNPSLSINTIGNMTSGTGYEIVLKGNKGTNFNYQMNNGFTKSLTVTQPTDTPVHFVFQPTGLPYNIIVENPTINNQSLISGDEIAAFDNGICVGAVVFNGDLRTSLTTWEGDPAYNLSGFTANDSIQLKIYSTEAGEEVPVQITSLNNQSLNYDAGFYSYVTLKAATLPTLLSDNLLDLQVYPNPFTESVDFKYQLQANSSVSLIIYDMLGKVVTTLVSADLSTGNYQLNWKGIDASGAKLPGGMYHYSFKTDDTFYTGRLIIVR